MPAPIIRKIPGLHKRVVGKITSPTLQNIHQNLQDGVDGLQIEHDFIVSKGNQLLSKLFDGKQETHVNIKHNDKDNWIIFDLGRNKQIDRIVLENGPALHGSTNDNWPFDLNFYLWTSGQNPNTDPATLTDTGHPAFNQNQITTLSKVVISGDNTTSVNNVAGTGTTQGFQYIAIQIIKHPTSGYNDGYINLKNLAIYESFDTRDYIVEFNDSVLDMHSWAGPRYNGCKTIGKEINKYNARSIGAQGIGALQIGNNFIIDEYFTLDPWPGDKTYGKTPNVENKTTALYITSTVVGGLEEEDLYARIKHHSYVKIEQILIINLNDDTVKILDSQTEDFTPYHRYITTDFPTRGKFALKLLDNNVQSNVKNEYTVKMNKGWLLNSFEYNSNSGPLPGMDKDKTTELNTTTTTTNNVAYTITNPLALYDAVSGSIQKSDQIYGFNDRLVASATAPFAGLYGCEPIPGTAIEAEPCNGKDSASISAEVSAFKQVFSYGPLYHSGSQIRLQNGEQTVNDQQYNPNDIGDWADGSANHISVDKYNQHAGGSLRFRFGLTSRINDMTTPNGAPEHSFYPLYTGDNTRFIDNKFTREFIKQENDTQFGVKNFDFPTIDEIEAKSQPDGSPTPPFSEWIGNSTINPSITASLFIGQCIQYLNSHSADTELHLTLFEGTKDFSGDNDEMSISTFEVDRNADPGYLDFAGNLGKLYNSVGPRAKYIKLKNSPQFRPTMQPTKYDRFTYDVIETSNFQATIEERQNAFVFGPGTPNLNISDNASFNFAGSVGDDYVSEYDNSPGNSGNFSGSFQYQLSFLDKDHTLITDIDKNSELFDGLGAAGAVLIPEHTHPAVKINLLYYLNKAGLINRTTVRKRVEGGYY